MKKLQRFIIIIFILVSIQTRAQVPQYYQEPTWKPRAILPYDDAINNNFWPSSPKVEVDYNDKDFDEKKLSKVPSPGIYPRVLITPTDVETIKAKIALGDKAPEAFKVMWKRVSKLQSPFYALVTNNDTLGRKLAIELVQKIKNLGPKIDEMNKRSDSENIWTVERSIIASGEPNPPSEIWDLLEYDYLHRWMTTPEREMARSLIAKIIKRRISNFLMVPDHFMINNHEGFGMEYIRLMLLIEGQEGFDQKLFDLAVHKANAMLSWFLDKDGMCYESIKGWLNTSAMVAVGLRDRDLLKHSHLRAKMNYFLAAARWEDNTWHIRDEMRASAFHVIWMMRYYHPTSESMDFLYQSTFTTHPFLNDPSIKWPDPVGICTELLLLYAEDGIKDKNGAKIDWTNQSWIDKLQLPTTWQDSARGYVETRNSWKKADLKLGFVCKQDFFYGGHEGSENNRITLWKDGVNWIQDNNMLATKATFLQNMLTIDGKGLHWPPVAGNWLGVNESNDGLVATGDGKMGYSFTKIMQVHPLAFPSAELPYYKPFAEGNFDLSRDIQVAFQPSTIQYNDGYAHTDYGPWSGETRLVEGYKPFNEVEKAYRTVQFTKGKYPYVIVVDDVQKDKQVHLYEWNISVPVNSDLVDATTPEIVFQNTEPAPNRTGDLIIAANAVKRDSLGKAILKIGDPLCLIRVLWRNTNYGFPVPKLEKFQGYALITIPAIAISPDFKVLIYPFKYGDPIPQTAWNADRTNLSVVIKDQKDNYQFVEGAGERTAIRLERNNKTVLNNQLRPKQPILIVRGKQFNKTDYRYTRFADTIPSYLVNKELAVSFVNPNLNTTIHYTIDGSEPTLQSPQYSKPILINKSVILKAKTFVANWAFADTAYSKLTQAQFVVQKPANGLNQIPAPIQDGLTLKLFEVNTKLYNDKGFFQANKPMLPDLTKYNPSYTLATSGFEIPELTPTKPLIEQVKAFYQFSGWFYANDTGVYTFHVNSCGPVKLDIANQQVLQSTGVFHQQQAIRSGEVILSKGWHPIQLVVCDPLFWNANSLEKMPLTVAYQINDGAEQMIPMASLKTRQIQSVQNTLIKLSPVQNLPLLEPGLNMDIYDRTGKRRDRDFLDIDSAVSFLHKQVNKMEPANTKNNVIAYNGYFHANSTGIYTFQLPYRVGDNVSLGGTQASCQSQLKIGNAYILQRGVYGRNLSGKVYLKEGWYPISFRLGTGSALCNVELPDGQLIQLNAMDLFRPVIVHILAQNNFIEKSSYEFNDSVQLALDFPIEKNQCIKYTLDGRDPSKFGIVYAQPFYINKTTRLSTIVCAQEKRITEIATVLFEKVTYPKAGSLGVLSFNNWDEKNAYFQTNTKFKVWIDPSVKLVKGVEGKAILVNTREFLMPKNVDVNVSRGSVKAGLKVYGLALLENALTVSILIKPNELNAKLFSKEGYNAFGKAYRTVSCNISNGQLFAMGNLLHGGEIKPGIWQHIVLTVSEQKSSLYLNGVLIATAIGTKDIMTDALDFFINTNALIENIQLFDRYLEKDEVDHLFKSIKKD